MMIICLSLMLIFAQISNIDEFGLESATGADMTLLNSMAMHLPTESRPTRYDECYNFLRVWIDSSLDLYKVSISFVVNAIDAKICPPQSELLPLLYRVRSMLSWELIKRVSPKVCTLGFLTT